MRFTKERGEAGRPLHGFFIHFWGAYGPLIRASTTLGLNRPNASATSAAERDTEDGGVGMCLNS